MNIKFNDDLQVGEEVPVFYAWFQSAMVSLTELSVEFFFPLVLIAIALIIKNSGSVSFKEFIRLPEFLLALVFLSTNSVGKYKPSSKALIAEMSYSSFIQFVIFLALVASILFIYASSSAERMNNGYLDIMIEGVALLTIIIVFYIRVLSAYRRCFKPIQDKQKMLKVM